ncbi:hypothetical protein RB595_009963 [Gaeumannomyces hyphopodioides]
MHSTQLLRALAVALTAFTTAHASVPDVHVQGGLGHQLAKRQSSGSGSTSAPPATTTTTSPRTTPTTPPTSPSTTPGTTTTTTPPPPPASTSDNNNNNNTPPPSTTPRTTPPQTTPPPTDKTPETTPTSGTPITSTRTSTIVVTDSANGRLSTLTSEFTTTSTAGLAGGSNGNNQQQAGMSEDQKKTIIGVVCGIGGAIVLAVVGIVAWRVWGRKRNQEEAEGAFGPSYSPAEKPDQQQPSSQSSRTPFQSTLESYHAPTQVNTASNF